MWVEEKREREVCFSRVKLLRVSSLREAPLHTAMQV